MADQVVVATGPFQRPRVRQPPTSSQLRSSRRTAPTTAGPSDVPDGRVLVVGGGNTGFQIAKELSATHAVQLAIGSRQTPLPQKLFGRDIFWWLTTLRLLDKTVDSRLGRRLRDRDTLIGSSPRELKRRYAVTLRSRVVAASGRTVTFADGSEQEFDAVIWATGYRPDFAWITAPVLDADGRLDHRRGSPVCQASTSSGWRGSTHAAPRSSAGSRPMPSSSPPRSIPPRRLQPPPPARRHPRSAGSRHERRGLLMNRHDTEHQADTDTHFSTAVAGLPTAVETEVVELAGGAPSTCGSHPSSSSSEMTRCACSPTTAPSRARPCASARVPKSPSTSPTTPRWKQPCTGTACDSRTATTVPTKPRRRFRLGDPSPIGSVPGSWRLLVPPAHP